MRIDAEMQIWKYKEYDYVVEVVNWKRGTQPCVNIWNIYVYLFPQHRLFEKVKTDSLSDLGVDFPFHGGVTFNEWYYDKKGKILYKQIGNDYMHIYDERFENYATKEEAREVFQDADELIEFLNKA